MQAPVFPVHRRNYLAARLHGWRIEARQLLWKVLPSSAILR